MSQNSSVKFFENLDLDMIRDALSLVGAVRQTAGVPVEIKEVYPNLIENTIRKIQLLMCNAKITAGEIHILGKDADAGLARNECQRERIEKLKKKTENVKTEGEIHDQLRNESNGFKKGYSPVKHRSRLLKEQFDKKTALREMLKKSCSEKKNELRNIWCRTDGTQTSEDQLVYQKIKDERLGNWVKNSNFDFEEQAKLT